MHPNRNLSSSNQGSRIITTKSKLAVQASVLSVLRIVYFTIHSNIIRLPNRRFTAAILHHLKPKWLNQSFRTTSLTAMDSEAKLRVHTATLKLSLYWNLIDGQLDIWSDSLYLFERKLCKNVLCFEAKN